MDWYLKRFEELDIDELYEILKIRNEVFVVEQHCAYQDCDGRDRSAYHLFHDDNGEISAYLRIFDKGVVFEEAAIGRVLIRESSRGKGIARDMMQKAIAFITGELGEDRIRIQAQAYLKEFYGSLGFIAVSDVYPEDGIPHLDMLYSK